MESVMRAGVPPSHANSGVTVRKPPWMAMEATSRGTKIRKPQAAPSPMPSKTPMTASIFI